MRTPLLTIMLASAFVVAGPAIGDDQSQSTSGQSTTATQSERQTTGAQSGTTATQSERQTTDTQSSTTATTERDKDATYGRIKELTAGQKVVVDVDNRPDKTYNLNEQDTKVNIASDLKVGDPVKITEVDHDGRKMVHIARSDDPSVKHGDKTAAEIQREQSGVRTDEARDVRDAGQAARDSAESAGHATREAGESAGKAAKEAGRDAKQAGKDVKDK